MAERVKRKHSEQRQRTQQLGVRLTPDEWAVLSEDAKAREVTPSEALRRAYFGGPVTIYPPVPPFAAHIEFLGSQHNSFTSLVWTEEHGNVADGPSSDSTDGEANDD